MWAVAEEDSHQRHGVKDLLALLLPAPTKPAHRFATLHAHTAKAPSPLLPPGWEQRLDPKTQRLFYVNHNTRSTTWADPRLADDRLTPRPTAAAVAADGEFGDDDPLGGGTANAADDTGASEADAAEAAVGADVADAPEAAAAHQLSDDESAESCVSDDAAATASRGPRRRGSWSSGLASPVAALLGADGEEPGRNPLVRSRSAPALWPCDCGGQPRSSATQADTSPPSPLLLPPPPPPPPPQPQPQPPQAPSTLPSSPEHEVAPLRRGPPPELEVLRCGVITPTSDRLARHAALQLEAARALVHEEPYSARGAPTGLALLLHRRCKLLQLLHAELRRERARSRAPLRPWHVAYAAQRAASSATDRPRVEGSWQRSGTSRLLDVLARHTTTQVDSLTLTYASSFMGLKQRTHLSRCCGVLRQLAALQLRDSTASTSHRVVPERLQRMLLELVPGADAI